MYHKKKISVETIIKRLILVMLKYRFNIFFKYYNGMLVLNS